MSTKKLMNHIERRAEKELKETTNDSKNMANQHRANLSGQVELEHYLSDQQCQRELSQNNSV